MTGRIVVLGSINLDLVVAAPRLPGPGETVLGGRLERHPGGKGANQAVAAARAGGEVVMLGSVGDDAEGRIGLEALTADGVDVSDVVRFEGPSGVAIIAVAPDGENQIVVAPGANALLAAEHVADVLSAKEPGPGDVLLASLEIPMAAVETGVLRASAAGATCVINPAPASVLPESVLAAGAILTPNRSELEQLTGAGDPAAGAERLLAAGARAVVVTLGGSGSLLVDGIGSSQAFPAHRVHPVRDTTGAGDTFNGALAAWLASGASLADAVSAANVAAALSIRETGARAGMPRLPEIRTVLAAS